MKIECLTPILNVSDMAESFAWFEKVGWKKLWDWGDPPTFGAVGCGTTEIFLCQGGQGSRGPRGIESARDDDGGTWMCWMLETPAQVDEAHAAALKHGLVVTWPPTDEPWGMREFHLRHPDGHTFRVGAGTGED